MIFRFSLYGFLKNQRYFEPFLILFFLDRGLSFTLIGLLAGIRELATSILEVPSGALADLHGRRRMMIFSFAAYIVSFVVFAGGSVFWHFAVAMVLYAVGDAFRTGTHKAMIFNWLRTQNRLEEKTRIYGWTRSWSKLGSAFSLIVATGCMFWQRDYALVFVISIVPYVLGIVNFLGYPAYLEGNRSAQEGRRQLGAHLGRAVRLVRREKGLQRLILESVTFEGMFKAGQDYLQPIIRHAALGLPVLLALDGESRSALLVGAVYFVLHLMSAVASRNAHRLTARMGGEESGVRLVWKGVFVTYLLLIPLLYLGYTGAAIGGFVLLFFLQNLFRPMHISRFDAWSDETLGATILSVESQSKSLATMVIAPLLGAAVDLASGRDAGGGFWPVGVVGMVLAAAMIVTARRGANQPAS